MWKQSTRAANERLENEMRDAPSRASECNVMYFSVSAMEVCRCLPGGSEAMCEVRCGGD
jgi:hypothetical protein